MKRLLFIFGIFAVAACSGSTAVQTVDRFPQGINAYYPSPGAPLLPQQLVKLPAGSIRPEGWIRRQLELQKDGLCGHLGEISAWLQKEDNAWLSTGGKWGWEEVPYWLRGYYSMGILLEDTPMLEESKIWIEAILSSQREDGYFGPMPDRKGRVQAGKKEGCPDYWPNMVALWILQEYYEYTADERVIPFMLKYFQYLNSVPDDDNPAEENVFKQLRLNMWVSSLTRFIPEQVYDLGNVPIDLEALKGRDCYGGLDLSLNPSELA